MNNFFYLHSCFFFFFFFPDVKISGDNLALQTVKYKQTQELNFSSATVVILKRNR